jgi:Major Facilitator Superfamily
MDGIPTRPVSPPISLSASVVMHGGIVVAGIVTTLLGPILPILIARWSLSDERAGLFFTAQFCGSMLGVASIGPLIQRGYRRTFVCGFALIAAGVAGLNLGNTLASLAAAAVFGCGLGQVLSAANLWVAEVAKDRRLAALSILNLMWGIGAIASSPLVMLAQRHGATSLCDRSILGTHRRDPGQNAFGTRNSPRRGRTSQAATIEHKLAKHSKPGASLLSICGIRKLGGRLGCRADQTDEYRLR